MPEGPFGGPRPFASVDNELMIRFKEPVEPEDQKEVRRTVKSLVNDLSGLDTPVSFVGGPSNDVMLANWNKDRVTETDLKAIRQTMNGQRGLDSSIAQVDILSVTLDK